MFVLSVLVLLVIWSQRKHQKKCAVPLGPPAAAPISSTGRWSISSECLHFCGDLSAEFTNGNEEYPSSSALFLLLLTWCLFRQIPNIALFHLQSHHDRMPQCPVIMWHKFPQSIWMFDELSPVSTGLNQCSQNMSPNLGLQSPSWNVLFWCWCSTVSLK